MGTAAEALELEVRRHFNAAPTEVFDAWTNAQALGAWFAPTADMSTIVHHLDAREGGEYRIEMRAANGTPHITRGSYVAFDRPNRLAFTWSWEGKDDEVSLVDITLRAEGDGCDLILRHSRFSTEKSRDGHLHGWDGCLSRLAVLYTTNRSH